MKKILIVLTGGTICSEYRGSIKYQGGKAETILENSFKNSDSPFADSVIFKSTENLGIFSENMTVSKWNRLIDTFRNMPEFISTAAVRGNYPSLCGRKNSSDENVFDGIIIAHGTDTLAYSAALFSILLKNTGVPVFLVSSNEALSSEHANGKENFAAAVECICGEIKPDVYVTYKNADGRMYLHLASRLTQCPNYSEDFHSIGELDISALTTGEISGRLPKDTHIYKGRTVDMFEDWQLENSVLKIEPYTGLDYDFFDFSKVKAVLHGTYHSGTVCSETADKADYANSIIHLSEKCGDIPLYVSPSDFSGGTYETVHTAAENAKIKFVNGFTDEMLYAKLLIAVSYEPLKDCADEFIYGEYNKEKII